jgi:hypothetical protein
MRPRSTAALWHCPREPGRIRLDLATAKVYVTKSTSWFPQEAVILQHPYVRFSISGSRLRMRGKLAIPMAGAYMQSRRALLSPGRYA